MAEHLIPTTEHARLPDCYVRPETQRPRLHEVVPDAAIPVVDLADPDRAAVVARVVEACRTHNFFQVLNHGVSEELMVAMLAVAYEFFRLPAEETAKLYSTTRTKDAALASLQGGSGSASLHGCLAVGHHPDESAVAASRGVP